VACSKKKLQGTTVVQ